MQASEKERARRFRGQNAHTVWCPQGRGIPRKGRPAPGPQVSPRAHWEDGREVRAWTSRGRPSPGAEPSEAGPSRRPAQHLRASGRRGRVSLRSDTGKEVAHLHVARTRLRRARRQRPRGRGPRLSGVSAGLAPRANARSHCAPPAPRLPAFQVQSEEVFSPPFLAFSGS